MLCFRYLYFVIISSTAFSCLFLPKAAMGNCIPLPNPSSSRCLSKKSKAYPIDTTFNLPSPLPSWPAGSGFASGIVDLGGFLVTQITTFRKIWAAYEGGPDNLGATIFEPSPIPEGFFLLGCHSQPNNKPLFGWVLVGKDNTNDPSAAALEKPADYTLVWSSQSLKIKQDSPVYIWLPTPSDGYKAVGHIITNSPDKPSLDEIRCVRSDLTEQCEADGWIWGNNSNGLQIFGSRPVNRGVEAQGVSTGTLIVETTGNTSATTITCLKNAKSNLSCMPNLAQIEALIQAYSPWMYFHPDEEYLPSTVNWFFTNGSLLYKKGDESNPITVDPDGSNLPQGGSNDGAYWLDLPIDESAKERVKKGDLQTSRAYFHIKPMLGATFTDLAIWIFYPFNGPAKAKVGIIKSISLGKIGEHVGDWEHVTLRISNFNGELRSVYFSQHSGGQRVDAPELEFKNGNKPVAYASLNGHASYSQAGLVLQGSDSIGIRNDAAKSNMVIDTGVRYEVISADYLSIAEPPWLNYLRKWGPKINYDIDKEIEEVAKVLPGKLKSSFEKFVKSLPDEILGEEGPTGPKVKTNWYGDEV
ncbi:hypothetical protein Nepgr_001437 [Nepenthes gracilis]|uniref:Vacuolar protein sorting-associated protein 62 n=1 Tax=Nepenthes gracilis TaxID=150966 RepID=A0AAD3RXK6_NEPGR|nr:hypothetical protein Nepgr_001437 [Nepenthes gracilis]